MIINLMLVDDKYNFVKCLESGELMIKLDIS